MNKKKGANNSTSKMRQRSRLHCAALLLSAVWFATSCNSDDEEQTIAPKPLSFTTGSDAAAEWDRRLVETDETHIVSFSVNAVIPSSTTPPGFFNFMANEVVVRDVGGTSWNYSPPRYWPESGATIRFYAYSPAGSVNVRTMTTTSGNTASMIYRVPLNDPTIPAEAIQEDFLIAAFSTNANPVALKFRHALAYIYFKVINNTPSTNFVVTAIQLLNLDREGNLAVDATTIPFSFRWNANSDYTSTYQVSIPPAGILIPQGTTTVIGDTDGLGLVILPQDLSSRGTSSGSSSGGLPSDAGPDPGQVSYLAVTFHPVGSTSAITTQYIAMPRIDFVNKKYGLEFTLKPNI